MALDEPWLRDEAVEGREPPPVSGWDGLRALEVAHVICESLETEVRAAQAAGR